MILYENIELAQGRKPNVQIRRYKKGSKEKTAENSQGKETGKTGKKEEQIARQQFVYLLPISGIRKKFLNIFGVSSYRCWVQWQ